MGQKLTSPLPTGAEYVRYCKKHPAVKKSRYSGDHYTVETDFGRATIADSKRELAPWLRRKIMLELVAIGLGLLIVAIIVVPSMV